MMTQYEQLKRPFRASKISWRAGAVSYNDPKTKQDPKSAIALAYIDARDVMERLDEVFGMNWSCKYSHAETKTICEISVLIDGVWITRANGAGDSDIEAEKGAISDAFKRAGVMFGIGRYLYDLPNEWVAVDKYKKFINKPKLPTGFYPIITDKQAAKYVEMMLDETKTKEEKTAIYQQAKCDCEEAEDKSMWEFITSAIKPKDKK